MHNSLRLHLSGQDDVEVGVEDDDNETRAFRSPVSERATSIRKTSTAQDTRKAESRSTKRLGILRLRNDYADPLSKDDELQMMKEAWMVKKSPSAIEMRHLSSITRRSYKTIRAWFEKHALLADDNDAVDVELQQALDEFDFLDTSSEEEDADELDTDTDQDLETPHNFLRPLPSLSKDAQSSDPPTQISASTSKPPHILSSQKSPLSESFTGAGSSKSSRRTISADKKTRLEAYFESEPMPSMSARIALAGELRLEVKSVSQWFAMKRFRNRNNESNVPPTTPISTQPSQESKKAVPAPNQPSRSSRRVRIAAIERTSSPSYAYSGEESRQSSHPSRPVTAKYKARRPRVFFPSPDLVPTEGLSTTTHSNLQLPLHAVTDSLSGPASTSMPFSTTRPTVSADPQPSLATQTLSTLMPPAIPNPLADTPSSPITRHPSGHVAHPQSSLRWSLSPEPIARTASYPEGLGVSPSTQHSPTSSAQRAPKSQSHHPQKSPPVQSRPAPSSFDTPLPSFDTFLLRTASRPYVPPSESLSQRTLHTSHPHVLGQHRGFSAKSTSTRRRSSTHSSPTSS